MKRASYVTRARLEEINRGLGVKQWEILTTLVRVRAASARQLQRLHFIEGTELSNARQAQKLFQKMTALGLITRLDRQIGGVRSGSSGYVYVLGPTGHRLVLAETGMIRINGRPRRPWTPGSMFLAHAVAVTDLYLNLIEAERSKLIELIEFQAEPTCWRTYSSRSSMRSTLKPDAFALFVRDGYEYAYFLEVDRSTEARSTIARKLKVYLDYFRSGREQARFGLFPKIVFLVPSEQRKQVLVDEASRLPAESWELFQILLASDVWKLITGRLS